MLNNRTGAYQIWVYIAYGFYFLLSLSWFLVSLFNGEPINFVAFFLTVVFGTQIYYKHLLANLIIGVITLFGSIFMLLQALNYVIPQAKTGRLEFFDKFLVAMPILSILMSGILIFSYLKLNFKD